jgi:hypothetical protein
MGAVGYLDSLPFLPPEHANPTGTRLGSRTFHFFSVKQSFSIVKRVSGFQPASLGLHSIRAEDLLELPQNGVLPGL